MWFLFVRIPAVQCHRHRSRQACLNAQEPYCGWNEHLMKCAQAPKQNHLATHWHQEVTKCPVLTDPVDGGWSAWSAWSACQHGTGEQSSHGHSHTHSYFDHEEVYTVLSREGFMLDTWDNLRSNSFPDHRYLSMSDQRVQQSTSTAWWYKLYRSTRQSDQLYGSWRLDNLVSLVSLFSNLRLRYENT